MNVKDLQAGPELDALVATQVVGWSGVTVHAWATTGIPPGEGGLRGVEIPRYSTDLAAAWEVVEFLRKEGFDFDCFCSSTKLQEGWSEAVFTDQIDSVQAKAETLPLAICRAALLVVSENPE
jgi:hypothetical protein